MRDPLGSRYTEQTLYGGTIMDPVGIAIFIIFILLMLAAIFLPRFTRK